MKRLFTLALLLSSALLFGCAHPITMNANLDAVKAEGVARIDKQVGYHIAEADRAREVTTPGGGGDKVSYFPYRDLEAGFYKALSEVFKGVTKIADPADAKALQANGIALLIKPEITTTSFSPSLFTWPPTIFTVALSCTVTDPQGRQVKVVQVQGEGRAEYAEFASDFSLASKRASQDVLTKLVKALAQDPDLRR